MTGLLTGFANAQSPWLSDSRTSSVSLEWDKPLFDDRTFDRDQISDASSVLFLTGRMRLADNFRFVAELPMSHFGYEGNNPFGGDDNSTAIGNIYAGGIWDINKDTPDNHAFVELGVRIPTAREPNDTERFGNFTGMNSEASDRMEAFSWDTWTVPLIGNYITTINGPFAAKMRLGTLYNAYVGDFEDLDNELHLLYGISGLYRQPNVEAHLGFSGRNPYVGNDLDFFDNGFTQLRAGVARPFGKITPGVYVRKPLGENYNQVLDLAYGLSLEVKR